MLEKRTNRGGTAEGDPFRPQGWRGAFIFKNIDQVRSSYGVYYVAKNL